MGYDVAFYRNAPSGPATQVLADALDSGRTVSGSEKLAQRLLLELLTNKNSVPGLTGGSDFLLRLATTNARTETDVFTALAASLSQVVTTLQAAQLDTDPLDEQLTGVRIVNLELDTGKLSLNLKLRTAAGTLTPVTIPLDFLVS